MTNKEKLSAIKAEIERLKDVLADPLCKPLTSDYKAGANKIVSTLSDFYDSLPEEPDMVWKDMSQQEKKDLIASLQKDIEGPVNTWQKQSENDIYDAVKGWGVYRFVCLMKDGTIQLFSGSHDETADGEITTHVDGLNDDYDDVDDIVLWIEIPNPQNG